MQVSEIKINLYKSILKKQVIHILIIRVINCSYWRTHPTLIWGLFGWLGTVGNSFGMASVPGFGSNMNLLQALSNSRTDAYGDLYREGTASLLNSMVSKSFTYTTNQVRDSFVSALSSDKSAAAQAQLFKLANEGRA